MRKLSMEELHRVSTEAYKQQAKIPLIVVLDNVRSMYNVGSVFRTCDAFSVSELILCGITACPPHKEINKTALGATESVCWRYEKNIVSTLENLKINGYQVYAIEQVDTAIPLQNFTINPEQKIAIVMGNEVFGVSDDALTVCDGAIEIPQDGTKHSLNVSVASGIIIWELFRKMFSFK